MRNGEVARIFERIANLLEVDGEDGFRVNAYRRAARSIKDTPEDIEDLMAEDRLGELPGVGKSTVERIRSFLETGTIDVLEKLEKKLPPKLHTLLEIPGMGPKKVAMVFHELKVKDLDDLKKVIASGKLAKLSGMGEASVKKIEGGIRFLERSGKRTPLGAAMPVAEAVADWVRGQNGVKRVEIAGSLRRGVETIGDVDLLCEADDGEKIIEAFTGHELVKRVLASGRTKGSITIEQNDGELQIDLRVVPAESFGAAWQYFTGSKDHNVKVREVAVKKKLRLNEYGLYDGDTQIAGKNERGIYDALELPFVPPELREDRGELADRIDVDELVQLEHIRGDLHMHTVASDGKFTIEEMAAAAKKLGYKYIAICDHSKSSVIANGLSIDRMKQHIKDIRKADDQTRGISIMVGVECDILPDGTLDYPDELLADCDWVVASIHAAMTGGSKSFDATDRTVAAMENRYVSAIGHPTGRLINRRPGMDLDMARIVKVAAETGTMLEVNASWSRLDLKDVHIRQAVEAGVMITINTDAHHTEQLGQMRYGVLTARRGRATRKSVANCLTPAALAKRVAAKRK